MTKIAAYVWTIMLFAWAGHAGAATAVGPTPYLSFADSPFQGTSFSYFYLETFETGAWTVPGVTADAGYISSNDIYIDSVDGDDGVIDGSGTGGHVLALPNGTPSVTFTFDATVLGKLPTHAGLVWTDSHPGYDTITFAAYDALGASLGSFSASLGDGTTLGGTAEDRFFGFINSGGISRITMSSANAATWEVDHLQYGVAAVPEPTTTALLAAGLASIAGWRRRQTHHTAADAA